MLNIRPLYRPRKAADYYLREEAGRGVGVWLGSGCAMLGLREGQQVIRKDFALALDGYAVDGRALVHVIPQKRRCAYDVVLSPTKSVSVAAVRGERTLAARIVQVVTRLAKRFVGWLEQLARSRGKEKPGTPLAIACFIHQYSRLGDEHLHVHFVTLNVTEDSGSVRAVEMRGCFKNHLPLERRFQQGLLKGLRASGMGAALDAEGRAILPVSPVECLRRSGMRAKIDEVSSRWAVQGKNRFRLRAIVGDRLAKTAQKRVANDGFVVRWADVEATRVRRTARMRFRKVGRRQNRNPWKTALRRLKENARSSLDDLWRGEKWSELRRKRVAWSFLTRRKRGYFDLRGAKESALIAAPLLVKRKQREWFIRKKELQKEIKHTSQKTL